MSQKNIECVVGRLVTDEGFRRRFAEDREATLEEVLEGGLKLNRCERRAFLALDPERIAAFAEGLDPCIQKVELGSACFRKRELSRQTRAMHRSGEGDDS